MNEKSRLNKVVIVCVIVSVTGILVSTPIIMIAGISSASATISDDESLGEFTTQDEGLAEDLDTNVTQTPDTNVILEEESTEEVREPEPGVPEPEPTAPPRPDSTTTQETTSRTTSRDNLTEGETVGVMPQVPPDGIERTTPTLPGRPVFEDIPPFSWERILDPSRIANTEYSFTILGLDNETGQILSSDTITVTNVSSAAELVATLSSELNETDSQDATTLPPAVEEEDDVRIVIIETQPTDPSTGEPISEGFQAVAPIIWTIEGWDVLYTACIAGSLAGWAAAAGGGASMSDAPLGDMHSNCILLDENTVETKNYNSTRDNQAGDGGSGGGSSGGGGNGNDDDDGSGGGNGDGLPPCFRPPCPTDQI